MAPHGLNQMQHDAHQRGGDAAACAPFGGASLISGVESRGTTGPALMVAGRTDQAGSHQRARTITALAAQTGEPRKEQTPVQTLDRLPDGIAALVVLAIALAPIAVAGGLIVTLVPQIVAVVKAVLA